MNACMNPMMKWIGGGTAATLLVLGGATLAGSMMETAPVSRDVAAGPAGASTPGPAEPDGAIPVDPAKLAQQDAAQADGALSEGEQAVSGSATNGEARLQQVAARDDENLVVKRILPIDGPIKYGEWHWNEEGAPATGTILMTVDLDARVISVFRDGYEIGAAAVLLGTDRHPTPLGTFPILYKMRHNVSEKYNNAPMPYSMFLTKTGIALHGSQVENGSASHGCVGMPDDFAAKVFEVAKKGDRVIITRGETLDMGEQIL